jgi:hypothetical protein
VQAVRPHKQIHRSKRFIGMNPFLKKIKHYINPLNLLRKEEGDSYLKTMHSINKISMLMFLICVVVLVVRALNR